LIEVRSHYLSKQILKTLRRTDWSS